MPTFSFVDAHIHLREASGLRDLKRAGVVAARDAGDARNAITGLVPRGDDTVRIVSAGWALFKKGGYGARFGAAVETRAEIAAQISALKRAGADIIKIVASGMVSLKRPGEITAGGFAADEIAFITDEARKGGLPAMAHANGEAAIIACAEAGVRSIEHGFFMTERALEVLAGGNTVWVPTVGALQRAADAGNTRPEVRRFVDKLISEHLRMIHQAYVVGVPLAIGTDCALPDPGYDNVYRAELEYFEQAGIPRSEVINFSRRFPCE